MILLHDRLPCSENFFRYLKNYDQITDQKQKLRKDSNKSPSSTDSEDPNFLKSNTNNLEPKSPGVRSINSPKYGLGMTVINNFIQKCSPTGSPVNSRKHSGKLNVDTQSQKNFLSTFANQVNKQKTLSPLKTKFSSSENT